MLSNFKIGERKTVVSFDLVFDDGYGNGFAFPCDKQGILLSEVPEEAKTNYQFCLMNPDRFVRFNKVIERTHTYKENNSGTCGCGNRVELWDQYLGACQCEKCGQWYNLFGQTLLPPAQWEE